MASQLDSAFFGFLQKLKKHNDRDWFKAHKPEFDEHVMAPMVGLVADLAPGIRKLSPVLKVIPKSHGGSIFRIYRDIRFSNDKSPYKTHMSAWFGHRMQREEWSAPGYYIHLDPRESFAAAGIWRPSTAVLRRIREYLLEHPDEWAVVRKAKAEFMGESSKRLPPGIPQDFKYLTDIMRKDFCMRVTFSKSEVTSAQFPKKIIKAFDQMQPLQRFLAKVVGLPW